MARRIDHRVALAVAPGTTLGGAERALLELARSIRDRGWDIHVVCLGDGPVADELGSGDIHYNTIPMGKVRNVARLLVTSARIGLIARRIGARVILGNMDKGQVYASIAGQMAAVPTVWWQHMIPTRSGMWRLANAFSARSVVVGSGSASDAQRALSSKVPVNIIPPPTPVHSLARRRGTGSTIKNSLGWAPDDVVVGLPGRVTPEKGHEEFLCAAKLIPSGLASLRYVVLGQGDAAYVGHLHGLVANTPIEGRVHFLGHKTDPIPWIDLMDIVVVPSWQEPFGLVLVEAMSLGKPVVTTNVGGPLDIVMNGVQGLLVPPRCTPELAGAISRLVEDTTLRERLGVAGSARALDFDTESVCKRFATVLEDAAR